MSEAAPPPQMTAPDASSRRSAWLAGTLIAVAALASYANSFHGPFILDDLPAITDNATIRHLWPLRDALSPPSDGQTVSGRPLVNLSLALNYALGGENVWGYHLFNFAVHLLAGLTVFGLIRRTLLRPTPHSARLPSDGKISRIEFADCGRDGSPSRPRTPRRCVPTQAFPVALATALLWTVHPLNTESVTYIVQRAESLAGLLSLFTFYAFARSVDSPRAVMWQVVSVGACLLGMATKEILVSAPLLVLLYDRTFVALSFRAALRTRGKFYAALAGTWLLLGWLAIATGNRGGTAGLGLGISSWSYLLTQCEAIVHYLRLAVWPHPLVLDYGSHLVTSPLAVLPQALALLALLAATVIALFRRPTLGFLGACFFCLLAPTSSLLPVASQTVAEHRMYLPLTVVLLGLVGLAAAWQGKRGLGLFFVLAVVGGYFTARRNVDYRSTLSIWRDTAAKRPENARAHQELAVNLARAGLVNEAIPEYETALRLLPDYSWAHHNYATALVSVGRLDEAIAHYEIAARQKPKQAETHLGLALVLIQKQRVAEAIASLQRALELNPALPFAHFHLANLFTANGRAAEALPHYEFALRQTPADPDVHNNFGVALLRAGRSDAAIAQFQEALHLRPVFPDAANNLATARASGGR